MLLTEKNASSETQGQLEGREKIWGEEKSRTRKNEEETTSKQAHVK